MKNSLRLIRDLEFSIRKYRLETEIEKVRDLIDRKKPQYIAEEENVFSKFKKNVSNKFNDKSFNDNLENHEKLINLLSEINEINNLNIYKDKINLINFNDLNNKFSEAFSDDNYSLGKLEFAMNVILDNCYEFKSNQETFETISLLMNEEKDYISNINKDMKEAYSFISLDKDKNLNKAFMVGGLLTLAVAGPLVSTLALGVCEGLSIIAASTLLASAAGISASYACFNKIDKKKLKNEFKKLNVEEVTMSLVKTTLEIIQVKKFNYEEDAKLLYESLVEQYIDLKSDVDICLFLNEEDIYNNAKKNEVFSRADIFLKKKCFNL